MRVDTRSGEACNSVSRQSKPPGSCNTRLISARLLDALRSRNAASRPAAKPVAPEMTARPGRRTGSGRKLRSSGINRGHSPARKNQDLPAPEAPKMTNRRSTPRSREPRSASSPRTIAASRPKNTAASSGSNAFSPR